MRPLSRPPRPHRPTRPDRPRPCTDTATVAATATTATTWNGPQFPTDLFGFDARQPFIDHDATKALNDPAYKIVTTWVAIGNRQDVPLPFALSDLQLWDAYDHRAPEPADAEAYLFTETVTPIWTPALQEGDIPPHAVVGGYVSWKVPWYVWPMVLDYRFRSEVANTSGLGIGWQATPLKDINGRYEYAIGRLFYRGVVKALPDGTFQPYAPITVAQFATMLGPCRGALQPGRASPTTPATSPRLKGPVWPPGDRSRPPRN